MHAPRTEHLSAVHRIHKYLKLGAKPVDTRLEQNHRLHSHNREPVHDKSTYQRLVGKLIYLTIIRTDISYAVSLVSQFMHAPRTDYLSTVHKLLKYLKGSPGQGILYKSHRHIKAEAYTDADWAGSKTYRKSTTGYCTMIFGNIVSSKSKKQAVTAKSRAEAEYWAHGCCEL